MLMHKKPTHDPIDIATMWAWHATTLAERTKSHEDWQRARRLWAMVDRMRGVD